ncbi:MAG: phage regulatory CII family protein [Verrucomicrobiota bacterium]
MESHEVIKQAIDKVGPKEVAAQLALSLSLIYKWAQPPEEGKGSGSRNPLDRIHELVEITGDTDLIQWLCQQSGGFFVRNPKSFCEDGFEVVPATNEIVQQFADLLSEITQAALDNSITEEESDSIRRVWDRLKMHTEGFVTCCEEGDFQKIPVQKK